jgi:penicillin-binding protein 1C
VGINPDYVLAVWIGNADGEGRPGLTGAAAAAPLLFDIFKMLPSSGWFETPYDDLVRLPVCRETGYQPSPACEQIDTILTARNGVKTMPCPYHQRIHLDKTGRYRVSSDCYRVSDMISKSWLALPPVMAWYYQSKNPYYRSLPPFDPRCREKEETSMDLIYPEPGTQVFIPKDFGGKTEKTLFVAAHRLPGTLIHWHLDQDYLGSTSDLHQMEVMAGIGFHILTLVAENGEIIRRRFQVVGK